MKRYIGSNATSNSSDGARSLDGISAQDAEPRDAGGILSPLHVQVILGHCFASVALLVACLCLLNRRPFSRYRLSCLLLVRWNCAADLACLLNKTCFALLDRPDLWREAGRHAAAWVCKLYHFSDNVTLTLQVWLLAMLAMERAAMCLRLSFALKHFSAFRLKIGAAVAGAVGVAAHLNYLWMFSVVGGGGADGQTTRRTVVDDDAVERDESGELICSVLPEFHSVYSVAVVLDVLFNIYAPILLCSACTLTVLFSWLCGRAERLNPPGQTGNGVISSANGTLLNRSCHRHYQRRQDAPNSSSMTVASGSSTSQSAATFQSAELVNISARVLFLVLALLCYPPLAVTGLFKAQTVHSRSELSQSLYPILYYIVQPTKNILSAIAYFIFVLYLMVAHKNSSCRRMLAHRYAAVNLNEADRGMELKDRAVSVQPTPPPPQQQREQQIELLDELQQ